MYLCKSVVEPGNFNLGTDPHLAVALIQGEQLIHLTLNLFRWAVLMYRPIWESWEVRKLLPLAPEERSPKGLPSHISYFAVLLTASEPLVKFPDIRGSEVPTATDKLHDEVQCAPLVLNEFLRIASQASLGAKLVERTQSNLKKRHRDAAIDRVETLNDTGFDRPECVQAILEVGKLRWVLYQLAICNPLLMDIVEIRSAQVVPIHGQIRDRFPPV